MQAAQAAVPDGEHAAVHAAGGQVARIFMRGGKVRERDERHVCDLAAGAEGRHAVDAGEEGKRQFVVKAVSLAAAVLLSVTAAGVQIAFAQHKADLLARFAQCGDRGRFPRIDVAGCG